MEYYYLKKDEIIQEGDEFTINRGSSWQKYSRDIGKPAYSVGVYRPRRLVKHLITQETLYNGIRMLMILANESSLEEDIVFARKELENLLCHQHG